MSHWLDPHALLDHSEECELCREIALEYVWARPFGDIVPRDVAGALAAMESPREVIRAAACAELARHRVFPALRSRLGPAEASPNVKAVAVTALAELLDASDHTECALLSLLLDGDAPTWLRRTVAQALGVLGGPMSAEDLLELVEEGGELGASAIYAVAAIAKRTQDFGLLLRVRLLTDRSPRNDTAVGRALARVRDSLERELTEGSLSRPSSSRALASTTRSAPLPFDSTPGPELSWGGGPLEQASRGSTQGNPEKETLDAWWRYALKIASRRLEGHSEEVHDVVQTSLLRLLIAWRAASVGQWTAFLGTIVRRRCADVFRRKPHVSLGVDIATRAGGPADLAVREEERRVAAAALLSLPSQDRALLELHFDGLSVAEIAEVIGATRGDAGLRLRRALQALRNAADALEKADDIGETTAPSLTPWAEEEVEGHLEEKYSVPRAHAKKQRTYRDIGVLLGIAESTVSTRVQRAREKIQERSEILPQRLKTELGVKDAEEAQHIRAAVRQSEADWRPAAELYYLGVYTERQISGRLELSMGETSLLLERAREECREVLSRAREDVTA
jgi:RNA polymerase sigma factor (sigma-70 family)